MPNADRCIPPSIDKNTNLIDTAWPAWCMATCKYK